MSSPQYHLSFRLDGTDHTKLIQFLQADGGAFLVVKELEATNPHYHGYIFTNKKIHSFRMQFKRNVLDVASGNGAYSVTAVRDLDKYYRYIMKGNSRDESPEVVARNGVLYTDDWVAQQHDRYWSTNDELMAARSRMKPWEAVLQACKDVQLDWRNKEQIAKLYITEVSNRNGCINIFSIRSYVQLIQVKLCPDDTAISDLATTVAGI